jgi:ABC-type multidrug transport system fused ATPase/permease subunit
VGHVSYVEVFGLGRAAASYAFGSVRWQVSEARDDKSVLVFLGRSGACMLWIGEPGSLVGPWAMPAERPGDRLGRSRDDLRSGRLMNAAKKPVVESFGLVKDFARTRAPCRTYLSVAAGEVHGFLGPDGAGKSITLRVLLGLIRSAAGTVRMFGLDRWADPAGTHRDIGVLRLTAVHRSAGSRHRGTVR